MDNKYPVSIKGVIWLENKIILVRNPRGELELPGGRIEVGEKPKGTLKREIFEEIGIHVSVDFYLDSGLFEVIPGKSVFIETFECRCGDEIEMKLSVEHTEIILCSFEEALMRNDLPSFYKQSINNTRHKYK